MEGVTALRISAPFLVTHLLRVRFGLKVLSVASICAVFAYLCVGEFAALCVGGSPCKGELRSIGEHRHFGVGVSAHWCTE